ncbi:putative thiol:disulfide interchange protein DsbC [Geobacter sp. OR-1]|uniref:DsbC family protein n=1 Tax=Geobacter sp. OR-1 TaxID=1266765 RepID=UPI000541BBA3|nr:DsbC family protein [Geobacter sp. OR-1]GAM09954.1 putative thiol:disulfide interchange protein DsbC [Geobacter sp. OR-1]
MKASLRVFFSVLVLTLISLSAFAAPSVVKPDVALRQAFPDLNFESMKETSLPGMYEVVSGQNILYFFPEKEYLFVGEIYTKDRKALSAERKKELRENTLKLVKTLPLEKAVKVGTGKNTVIEFTDPDCPYCRKASAFLNKRKDVTRYIFFAPFAHPQAITKIHHILSAKDKAAAYEDMMAGKAAPQGATYSEAIQALAQEHIALARKVGVQGTPTFFINDQEVVGADEKKIEGILGGQK